ncbi:MAG: helix-turn-helix domain-containing protein [Limisphaerales bacterium]
MSAEQSATSEAAPALFETLGKQIRRLRLERGFTVARFADACGVSRPTIWSWESGRTCPRMSKMVVLASVLNLSASQLQQDRKDAQELKLARRLRHEVQQTKINVARIACVSPQQIDIAVKL